MAQRAEQARELQVYDPRGDVNVPEERIADRVARLEGTTVGLLDNSKTNADVLLREVGRILEAEYGVDAVVYRAKDTATHAAGSIAEQLAGQCDVVVNAYGDCGSCTSWCVFDSIDLEKKGTPTATINSEEFVNLGQSEARSLGMPGLPIVTVPHPMGGIPETEVKARAETIVPEVVEVLTGSRQELEEEYRDKYLDMGEALEEADLYCPIN
jgi:hypothetical protein